MAESHEEGREEEVNLSLEGILNASKNQLEKLIQEYDLVVPSNSTKAELQFVLINCLNRTTQEREEPPSPVDYNPSPVPDADDLKRRELDLNERRLRFEIEKEERDRKERKEREAREREKEERERLDRLEQAEREERAKALQYEHEERMRRMDLNDREREPRVNDDEIIDLRSYQGVPKFSEDAVDDFFCTFERQAKGLRWPKERWPIILGSVISGKAQAVYNSLPEEEAGEYELLKAEILKRYALTPQAYRQQYMKCRKAEKESYKEFASNLKGAHDRWLKSISVESEVDCARAELLERFKRAIPANVRIYLEERAVENVFDAASLADSYQLIHEQNQKQKKWGRENKFVARGGAEKGTDQKLSEKARQEVGEVGPKSVRCFKCGKPGHLARNCWQKVPKTEPKGRVALIGAKQRTKKREGLEVDRKQVPKRSRVSVDSISGKRQVNNHCGEVFGGSFEPFTSEGEVVAGKTRAPIVVFRDTGASLTIMRTGAVPEVDQTYTGKRVLIYGISGAVKSIPLHQVELYTREYTGAACVGLCPELPIPDVDILVGNDLAGGEVVVSSHPSGTVETSSKEMLESAREGYTSAEMKSEGVVDGSENSDRRESGRNRPDVAEEDNPILGTRDGNCKKRESGKKPIVTETQAPDPVVVDSPVKETEGSGEVFTMAVLTRSARKKLRASEVDLEGTFMSGLDEKDPDEENNELGEFEDRPTSTETVLKGDLTKLIEEQQQDNGLAKFIAEAEEEKKGDTTPGVFFRKGLLLRRSRPLTAPVSDGWRVDTQLVVPEGRREQLVDLAHNSHMAGHLGITKTYEKLKKHFFWPKMKKDVKRACKRCDVCQRSGKKGQEPPPVKLMPIPVVEEPFSRVVLDCVGPLPRSKRGYQYLLTIMCMTTRYVEAVPLRNITTGLVVEAMLKFFTTFGLPKEVQTDRGTNFMSRIFNQSLKDLGIRHVTSSAYHPQSQGAIERFHHTLKEMLRCYCNDEPRKWPTGVPFVLFAVRDSVQEALGYSPFELVFGHDVRGPLKMIKETWMNERGRFVSATQYMSEMKERMIKAVECANDHLKKTKTRMKVWYDRKAREREYEPGDRVLVLIPTQQNPLVARYVGPYRVKKRVGPTTYVIDTPDRRRKTKMCHANMLKTYHGDNEGISQMPVCAAVQSESELEDEKLWEQEQEKKCMLEPQLRNSECFNNIDITLGHLEEERREQLKNLLRDHENLFADVPRKTHLVTHDVELSKDVSPIKQHAYRIDPMKREVMRKEVRFLLENGLAEPSCSAWSSPCILVQKGGGQWRLCTDYRKVNAVTKTDSYPIPRIDDCVDNVGQAKFVTKIDLLKGYYGIPLTDRAKELSAFVTPDGLYQYTVLPFGLKGAPATFQRMMNTLLQDIPKCQAYLDDLVICSETWEEHLTQLRTLLQRLDKANLTVNLSKSEFAQATIQYLGHEVGNGQVRTQQEKVLAIQNMSPPDSKKAIRRFLGMVGYYRRFCCNFAEVALPLTTLLQKPSVFKWTEQCQQAFNKLKLLLMSSPVLLAPDPSKSFELMVDASDQTMGAVLVQNSSDGVKHPVAYYSKKFLKYQQNYSTVEKEALSLLSALLHFEVYLRHPIQEVIVHTDHNPLVFLKNTKGKNQRLLRWSLILQEFPIKIVHIPGRENVLADTLTRC